MVYYGRTTGRGDDLRVSFSTSFRCLGQLLMDLLHLFQYFGRLVRVLIVKSRVLRGIFIGVLNAFRNGFLG